MHAKLYTPLLTISNITQQIQAWNLASNFFTRLDQLTLGRSKPKWSRQHLATSILLVLNNFINRRLTTKSRDDRSDLSRGQASKPYSKIGIHLMFINCKAFSGGSPNSAKYSVCWSIKRSLSMINRASEICGLLYTNNQIPYFAHPWKHDTFGRTDRTTREVIPWSDY